VDVFCSGTSHLRTFPLKIQNCKGKFTSGNAVELAGENDIVRFRNAQDGRPSLLYNKSRDLPYLLRDVSIEEIEAQVILAEREVVDIFWEARVLEVVQGRLRWLVPTIYPSGRKEFLIDRRRLCVALQGGTSTNKNDLDTNLSSDGRLAFDEFVGRPCSEQMEFLRRHKPTTMRDLAPWVVRHNDCSSVWLCAPSEHHITSPKKWIGQLAAALQIRGKGGIFPLLLALRLRRIGVVIWPNSLITKWGYTRSANLRAIGTKIRRELPDIYRFVYDQYQQEVARKFPDLSKALPRDQERMAEAFQNRLVRLYFSCSIEAENECSWEFAEGCLSSANTGTTTVGSMSIGLQALAKQYDLNGHNKVTLENPWLRLVRSYIGEELKSESLGWSEAVVIFYNDIIKPRGIKHEGSDAGKLRPFFLWLKERAKLEGRLLMPLDVTRQHLWSDEATQFPTFRSSILALATRSLKPRKHHNGYVQAAREFFLHLQSRNANYKCPLYVTDKFKVGAYTKSVHGRVPGILLRDMREFIVMRKDPDQPPSGWSELVRDLPYCQQKIVIDGAIETIFCPVMPAVLWLMAQWPLRSSQVLWLDSGELDEYRYDFNRRGFVKNARGIVGREAGVIAIADDETAVGAGFGQDHHLDFRVIRNKRLLSERSEYTIPYMDGDTLWILQQVLEWQQQYGVTPVLVKENQQQRANQNQQETSPEIVALFRLPNNQSKYPPYLSQLTRFWQAFGKCYDAENRLKDNRYQLVRSEYKNNYGDTTKCRPRDQYHIIIDMVYDLHSLRVGGVSELLDRGMPLALVAAIAGHRSLSMTLYYYKLERATIRAKISTILRSNPGYAGQIAEVDKLLRAMDETAIAQLSGNISILRQKLAEKQAVMVTSRGICPGTTCEEGLKSSRMQGDLVGGVVPDRLCPLCQFWIIGPMFLPGLAKWMNELLEELEMASKRQERLYREMKELDSKGRSEDALHRRNEQELLERACVSKSAAVASLFQMIMKLCRENDRRTEKVTSSFGLVIAGGDSLRPRLQGIGRFEKIHEMQLLDHLLPWQTSDVGEKVTYEHTLNLMAALRDHGAAKFFVGLPRELQRTANIALGELMIKVVPTVESLESIYQGQKLLTDVLDGMEAEALSEALRNLECNLKTADGAALEGDPADLLLPPKQTLLSN
jgi:hypothetical protein